MKEANHETIARSTLTTGTDACANADDCPLMSKNYCDFSCKNTIDARLLIALSSLMHVSHAALPVPNRPASTHRKSSFFRIKRSSLGQFHKPGNSGPRD